MEFVFRLAFAGFRRVRAVRFQDRHAIAGHAVFAPHIDFVAFRETDLERSVSLDRPNCAERICPSTDYRRLPTLLKHRAACDQRETHDSQTEGNLFVHGRDAVDLAFQFQAHLY